LKKLSYLFRKPTKLSVVNKNLYFSLSVKTWFEPMFLTGSLAVFIGAAPPPFRIFAGVFLAAAGGEMRSN